ncbi:MAG TPA: hypothetical protein VF590_00080, partial [Isosphaeraceae bacterium]
MRRTVKTLAVAGTLAMLGIALMDSSAQACFGKKKCRKGCAPPVTVICCPPPVTTSCGGYGGGYAPGPGYGGGMGYGGGY